MLNQSHKHHLALRLVDSPARSVRDSLIFNVRLAPHWTSGVAALLLACAGCHGGRPAPGAAPPAGPPPARLTFNQDVEPILSENCYSCHGPDPGPRKARLRLDRAEFALAPRGQDGPAIRPGDPDHSLIIQRVEAREEKKIMPPPEAHKTLSAAQIAVLRQWVREGATYQEHWSFIPPALPPVPAVQAAGWPRNPIDRFVLARLEREHLNPSPEADRPTLIRRVTYDLTGLPPAPADVDAFVNDPSPNAYEKVVDRLLASPRYGEHRAHYWLDVARFGDTHGLHIDNYRSIWPYRDYVIKSYNEDKPFDQFVREQLAGDLLPPRDIDQLVATAFVRAGVSTGEGGTIIEELRVNNQLEGTEMLGAAFLGLTTGCAVCHDHKFDPTTQKDFYQLTAFFNNLAENPSNDDRADWPPYIVVPLPARRAAYERVLAERAGVLQAINARESRARELIAAWLARADGPPRPVSTAGLAVRLRFDEQAGATFANAAPHPAFASVTATGVPPAWGEDTWFWPSARMETGTHLDLPAVGNREWRQPFSAGTWLMPRLETSASSSPAVGAILARVDPARRGWELIFDHGKLAFRLVHQWPDHAIVVETEKVVLTRGRWNHLLVAYDGSGLAAGVRIYVDGRPQPLAIGKDALDGSVAVASPLRFGREGDERGVFRQARLQDFRFYDRALDPDEAARVPWADRVAEIIARAPPAAWSEDESKTVSDYYFANRDGVVPALAARLPALEAELAGMSARGPEDLPRVNQERYNKDLNFAIDSTTKDGDVALVCEESPQLAYANVLARGVYTARIERVRPAIPHFLPPLPPGAPRNRLGLADWIVSPANPLTARVTVNRMWAEVFGAGIVETTEDFGVMGAKPSHPELLDWLAIDFRDHGWDVKRFYKQLVMSATYRQSARITPQLLEQDPKNRLLARGPRFRMDAEMLRDTVLSASGLLVDRIGGPSVKPYQPEGVWESGGYPTANTTYYQPDHGPALYRRSLYTFWKRMATMPDMDAFDAPPRDGSCTRRQRTNTPLQALVAMNDPQWLEAARCLAERVIQRDAATDRRLDDIGRLLLARPWRPREQAVLHQALARFSAVYDHDLPASRALIAVGESRPNPALPANEVAAWMLVASTAFNLDATLNK